MGLAVDVEHRGGGVGAEPRGACLVRDQRRAAMTLAGLVNEGGLRCGTVIPSRPGDLSDAQFTWHRHDVTDLDGLAGLAEEFADWLVTQSRRVAQKPIDGTHGRGST
jgi:hypothetical protein